MQFLCPSRFGGIEFGLRFQLLLGRILLGGECRSRWIVISPYPLTVPLGSKSENLVEIHFIFMSPE